MLKIQSNLKINGRHWGLAFADGIAYTANVALAAKLLLKGYVVTDQQPEAEHTVAGDINVIQTVPPAPASPIQAKPALKKEQPDQPVAGPIHTEQGLSHTLSSPAQEDTGETVAQPEQSESILDNSVSNSSVSVSNPTSKSIKPRATRPRKKVVTADAVDER